MLSLTVDVCHDMLIPMEMLDEEWLLRHLLNLNADAQLILQLLDVGVSELQCAHLLASTFYNHRHGIYGASDLGMFRGLFYTIPYLINSTLLE